MPGRLDPESLGGWMSDIERRMRVLERGSGVRETGIAPGVPMLKLVDTIAEVPAGGNWETVFRSSISKATSNAIRVSFDASSFNSPVEHRVRITSGQLTGNGLPSRTSLVSPELDGQGVWTLDWAPFTTDDANDHFYVGGKFEVSLETRFTTSGDDNAEVSNPFLSMVGREVHGAAEDGTWTNGLS